MQSTVIANCDSCGEVEHVNLDCDECYGQALEAGVEPWQYTGTRFCEHYVCLQCGTPF